MIRFVYRCVIFFFNTVIFIPIIGACIVSRFKKKKFDIGLGPEPMINNVYHKMALQRKGYSCQTFVSAVYFITDQFDVRGDKFRFVHFIYYYLFFLSIMRYRCIYIYFNGGPLGFTKYWRIEPLLYKLANVKTVIMPYGGDVQDLTRTSNLCFRNFMAKDYKSHRLRRQIIDKKIDLWTKHADCVISGCDWVEYMYYWDTLMLAHFSIDTELWKPDPAIKSNNSTLRILHAPNHTAIKGTQFFVKAINELKEEGYDIELVFAQKVPNDKIRELMQSVDVVADQLVIGWYAMFALEAMSLEKPVLCYIREDFETLYIQEGLIEPGELPIINTNSLNVKETIRSLVTEKEKLQSIGKRSREYVIKHHSIESIGNVFDKINSDIGIKGSVKNQNE